MNNQINNKIINKDIERARENLKRIIDPAIKNFESIFNSPGFKRTIKIYQEQAKIAEQVFKNSQWEKIVKQQLEIQKQIRKAYENLNLDGLNDFVKILNNNFYKHDKTIEFNEYPRIETFEIKESIDVFEKKAEEKKDKKNLKKIKEVKQKIDENLADDIFTIYFTNNGKLQKKGDRKNSIEITSKKLISIITELAGTNYYVKTSDLQLSGEYTNIRSIHNAISTLRKKIKKLGFDGNPIESKQGHGYVMNSKIKLTINPFSLINDEY